MGISRRPTILFVHGACHNPANFQRVTSLLNTNGFETSCPSLPTVGASLGAGLQEDAACIAPELHRLVEDEEKDVIVMMHSYGGVVRTQAVHETFSVKDRKARSLKGGVLGLAYLCAFVLALVHSLACALGGDLPPCIEQKEDGTCYMLDPAYRFHHDISPEEQDHWISELRPQPTKSQKTHLDYVAYRRYSVHYLYCDNDRALPLEVQKMMVERIGVLFSSTTCSASHSPFLSQLEVTLQLSTDLAKECGE